MSKVKKGWTVRGNRQGDDIEFVFRSGRRVEWRLNVTIYKIPSNDYDAHEFFINTLSAIIYDMSVGVEMLSFVSCVADDMVRETRRLTNVNKETEG